MIILMCNGNFFEKVVKTLDVLGRESSYWKASNRRRAVSVKEKLLWLISRLMGT